MIDSGYTSEELAWLEANRGIVRAIITASPRQMAAVREETSDPVTKAVKGLISTMKSYIHQIDAKIDEVTKTISQYREYIQQDMQKSKEPTASFVDFVAERGPNQLATLAAHKQALLSKIATLQNDPETCFLPIGTVVSFVRVPTYADGLSPSDDRKSYPVEGSVGVVTRIRQKGEYALGVSMRKPFRDGWNSEYDPDYDRMPTYKVDRDMLDVVGYGLLPNGEEYRGFGFQATYARQDGGTKTRWFSRRTVTSGDFMISAESSLSRPYRLLTICPRCHGSASHCSRRCVRRPLPLSHRFGAKLFRFPPTGIDTQ
jgi:hypothetical protein